MKAKIVHDKIKKRNPEFNKDKFLGLNRLEKKLYLRETPQYIFHEKGAIVDHEEAYVLVTMGIAIPDDDECKEAAGMTDEQISVAIAAYKDLSRGMSTGIKKYDAEPDEDDEFEQLLEGDEDIVSTD